MLEESNGHYFGESNYRSVRVVFKKQGSEWKAFPSGCGDLACLKSVTSQFPLELKWVIAFDGRNVGRVTSARSSDFHYYSDIGQQAITSPTPVPTIGSPSPEFGGNEAKVHRPLMANSQPYFADPDRWTPSVLSSDLTTLLRQAFRKKFLNLCRSSEGNETKLEPFPYRDEDVKPMKTYTSGKGWVIARMHLEAIDCRDTEAGFDIDDPWFFVDENKHVGFLDSGMWLVDAGDYDNDGRSELIFSISRDNEGGYEIWYDDFRKHATFKFHYH